MGTDRHAADPASPAALLAACRDRGLIVTTSAAIGFTEALEALSSVTPLTVGGLYWAGRATLVGRPVDIASYDEAFLRFLAGGGVGEPVAQSAPHLDPEMATDVAEDEGRDHDIVSSETRGYLRYSAREVLRHRDLATCDADELAEVHRLLAQIQVIRPQRRSRRRRRSATSRGPIDLRRTTSTSLRTDGELLRWYRTGPSSRPRPIVLLVDISGSMDLYVRALLRFAQVAVGGRDVEVFALGTRLTRLTRELRGHDPDRALLRATDAVPDWSGGTRLGATLRSFNDDWGIRGTARGATVVVLSDGWDQGDPEVLAEQLARLKRVAHRLIWVNPLKASPGYEPLAAGMAAALPHLDDFVQGHSLGSLESLALLLGDDR